MRNLIFRRGFQYVFLIIIVLKFVIINGWHATEYHAEKPARPGKCFSHQFGMYIKIGKTIRNVETKLHKYCHKMTCLRDIDGDLKILHAGCPYLIPKSNCKVVSGSKDLPFPLCCPHLQCSEKVRHGYHVRDEDYAYLY